MELNDKNSKNFEPGSEFNKMATKLLYDKF